MAFRKDTPAPFAHRTPGPPALDLGPNKRVPAPTDSPPPLTPPFRIRTKGRRVPKVPTQQSPTPRETYLEDAARNDLDARGVSDGAHPDERISHDLSLTDNTRHSIMDNMLLSLNPDQPAFFASPPSHSRYPSSAHLSSPPKTSRSRGHKHSSSLNSDYTYPSNPSDASPYRDPPRTRRSQSSSNFPTAAGVDGRSERVQSADGPSAPAKPLTSASIPSSRSGARKSSKSSGSSSVDFGHAMISTRWQSFTSRRSSSFDHGHRGTTDHRTTAIPSFPQIKPSQRHVDLDAAPTPTIPGGPGGQAQSPSRRPVPFKSAHIQPDSRSQGLPHASVPREPLASPGNEGRGVHRNSGRDSSAANSRRGSQHMASMRGFISSRAGSPTRPALDQPVTFPSANHRVPKEKPGFFRRVFGSKEKTATAHDHRSSDATSSRPGSRPEGRLGLSSSGRFQRQTAAEIPGANADEAPPPVLTKKPSSFFRRRKKSTSERTVTPALPPHLQTPVRLNTMTAMADGSARGSPVSSLHEAMDSFLSMPDQPRQPVESRINRKKSQNEETPVPVDTAVYRSYMNTTPSPKTSFTGDRNMIPDYVPSKLGGNTPAVTGTLQLPDRSFLHDNSSNEDKTNDPELRVGSRNIRRENGARSVSATMENQPPKGQKFRPATSDSAAPYHPQPLGERSLNIPEGQAPSSLGHHRIPGKSAADSPSLNEPTPKDSVLATSGTDKIPNATTVVSTTSKDAPISPISDYQSATSEVSPLGVDDLPEVLADPEPITAVKPSVQDQSDLITAAERDVAKGIFGGDESVVVKGKVAAWMGEASDERTRLRRAYMECFEFQDLNILAAFREVCARLVLRGETQQVDRILDAFSCRWCQCNPEHGFKATGEPCYAPGSDTS